MSTMVLADNLNRTFTSGSGRSKRSVHAVKDVSFRIERGTCLAVVGESGSGKTTVARMLVGLESADSGTITVDGRQVTAGSSRRIRRQRSKDIQMVFQDPQGSLNRRLPVSTAVTEILQAHGTLDAAARRERCLALFAEVGLEAGHASSYPDQLSGGQKQRVAIARALAAEPSVIVLDEAVSALDVTVQAQILALLERLRLERQLTYLFITHDLAVARQVADTVMVMQLGSVVEYGTAGEVLDAPKHPYTRQLMDSAPRPGWVPRRRDTTGAVS
ncbi:MAG: transporter ATP-binding protein [Arthrobacter koreensis]|jgi:ABC-type glutathione transport system ATPase component|uniref:ABC transporter ATP-binding protein n=1 Tax=Arthrobacter koreensis TaxID=199136 RepID=UPI0024096877|nr:ATP-binding cassette domain-containing protein [Arthrobacter koreensis]MDF2497424.1 transporter ATP-binding protein [Arthrobacter koreensis]